MKKLTLDTMLLIKAIDKKPGHESVLKICKWHSEGKVIAYVSSRLFNPDSVKMEEEDREKIRVLLESYSIKIMGNIFRLGMSPLGGPDMLSGGATNRTKEELEKFRTIVGKDPAQLSPESVGKRLSNKIGDYDSLHEHFCQKRDIFLTYDKKDYLHTNNRSEYEKELGIIICDPEEFVRNNHKYNT